ncbi:L,D-transpeptidase [Saccharothrix sp. AJ9571]|nr:L,D-transpeptidase [Saccharothrix sp. AJ9571]
MIDGDDDRRAHRDHQHEPRQDGATGPTTPSGARRDLEQPPTATRRRRIVPWTVVALVAAALGVAGWAVSGDWHSVARNSGTSTASPAAADADDTPSVAAPRPVSQQQLDALPAATVFGTVLNATTDPQPDGTPSGRLVHPTTTVPLYSSPGGLAIAAVPPTQLVSDTWLPIVAERPGWVEVLVPSRPNDSTGWIYLDSRIVTAHSPYRIEVDRATFTMTLVNNGTIVAQWPVGIGKPSTPTPATRTFILASIKDSQATVSPIVLPLGAHSEVFDSYGGGPGTLGIHTWPNPDSFGRTSYGRPSSDGCIRIPPDALRLLSTEVPIGSPVLIR